MAETTPELEHIIKKYQNELESMGIHVENFLLFGSQATGTATEGSDIDLFVISRDWANYGLRERFEVLGIAAARILEPIQARGVTPDEIKNRELSPFWQIVLEEQTVPIQGETFVVRPIKIDRTQTEPDVLHTPFTGAAHEFSGNVTLKRLVWAGDSPDVELLGVWFSAGARTLPHIHDSDQVLHVLEGTCAYGDENGVTLVHVGELITIPAGVWHWHGATPDAPMMHISIRKMGNSTNWQVEEKDWRTRYEELK
jgi:quercetin dioxygenase-like cupin family protein/predicted nucleotidyltransferase